MNVYPAELIRTAQNDNDQVVKVSDPIRGPVIVRWRARRPDHWRCRICGPMTHTDCLHTFSAGLVLAEQMFGLRRADHLHPTERASA